MLAVYQDWQIGHSPVTQGRARWLPSAFVQAMRACREAIQAADYEARRPKGGR